MLDFTRAEAADFVIPLLLMKGSSKKVESEVDPKNWTKG